MKTFTKEQLKTELETQFGKKMSDEAFNLAIVFNQAMKAEYAKGYEDGLKAIQSSNV